MALATAFISVSKSQPIRCQSLTQNQKVNPSAANPSPIKKSTQMKVEVYRLNQVGNWSWEILGNSDILELKSVGLTLTMADIYDQVLTEI